MSRKFLTAMRTVLVTGGIASGKSTVCKYLETKGFRVYFSDDRVKEMYASREGLVAMLEESCGLPYSQWGRIFELPEARLRLEKALYPLVLEDFGRWRMEKNDPLAFFESAVALEKDVFKGCFDAVVAVDAPRELRIERNPRTPDRIGSQGDSTAQADIVIYNDSTLEELYRKVDEALPLLFKKLNLENTRYDEN